MCEKHRHNDSEPLIPIVTGVSYGPDVATEPYVNRLKGINEEREPQGKWMRKQGGGTS